MKNRSWKPVKYVWMLGIAGVSSAVMWDREAVSLFLLLSALNLFTVICAWWTAEKIFQSGLVGMLGGLAYTWAPYRLYSATVARDYRELAAWALLPLAGYAGYWLFGRANTWWRKALSGILVPFAGMVLINGYSWLKDGKSLLAGSYVLAPAFSLQERGVYVVHYLMTFFWKGCSVEFGKEGMADSAPLGIGFPVTAGVIAYLWMLFSDKVSETTKEKLGKQLGFCNAMLLSGVMALIASTNSFPWDNLRSHYNLYTVVTVLVQNPSRIMGIAMLCFWLVSCMAVSLLCCWRKEI